MSDESFNEKINAEDVFNLADFQSIRLYIEFKNTTTRTETNKVALVEINDKKLVLDIPPRNCNERHSALIDIYKYDGNEKNKKNHKVLSATGKVIKVEEGDEDNVRVTFECFQYDDKSWSAFLNIFNNRQDQINRFFKNVKGY